jgi:hypothetical protein
MNAHRQKEWEGGIRVLNTAIETIHLAEKTSSITQAKAAFSAASAILTMISVCSPLVHSGRLLTGVYRIPWSTKWTILTWG